jgi:uncharacterized phage-like protein YoqJ
MTSLPEASLTVIAATGHRPDKLGGWIEPNPLRDWIRRRIYDTLVELTPTRGISGMALGVDQDFAQACVDLRIPFTAAVPFKDQEMRWNREAQKQYTALLSKATTIVYVCEPEYADWKMRVRNEWMVDRCNTLLAVFDGSAGGTANTFLYAQKIGREIRRINPKDCTP